MRRRLKHLAGQTGEIRTASFRGAQHLVVPVVALVEGVVRPSNSSGPELALASEFAHAPAGWNGRPVMVGHPTISGTPVPAGDPAILERDSIGSIFKANLDGQSLKLEAWIDEARARELGGEAEAIVERLQAGEQVEVSVGVIIDLEEKKGEWNDKPYSFVWRSVMPDHLALLREGEIGACSIEMGCGAPRVASSRTPAEVRPAAQQPPLRRVLARLLDFFRGAQSEDELSDNDLRQRLDRALQEAEPEFFFIESVFPGESTVVYTAFPPDGGDLRLFRRTYEVSDDGVVALSEGREEVQRFTQFEPVRAASACTCGKSTLRAAREGQRSKSMTKTERITALIANTATPFTEADQKWLEAAPDERLTAIEGHYAEPASPAAGPEGDTPAAAPAQGATAPSASSPESAGTPATPASPPKEKTPEEVEAEFLKAAPESIRTMVARQKAADTKRRTDLVSVLKTAQDAYTEEELGAMPLEDLERLVRVAKAAVPAPDYSGRGVPRPKEDDEPELAALSMADYRKRKQGQTAAAS